MRFSGSEKEVQDQLLKHMYISTNDIFVHEIETHSLFENSTKAAYRIITYASSRNQSGFGYLLSNQDEQCRGLYMPGRLQLIEAAQFARLVIPELFPSVSDEEQELIFQQFIKSALCSVIQEHDSVQYLWELIQFTSYV
ncbi:hypothetical protein JOD82_002178 [Paenibacillus sp. 1182]|uniref:hypothetical protein n=1 Tax=Paenibacillus sp. 1182 TaxID=2806565 RepID=UPI001AEB558D|nr:hypothetical protein [Paenibacillus sp. 1182]MBP1309158.1 hypothetical protein [Paenibacillus sp. 1182]